MFLVVTDNFKTADFNFKKAATSWWGKNISSLHNQFAKDDKERGRKYSIGDILFIFTKNSTLDNKGIANIRGFLGGFLGLNAGRDQSENDFTLDDRESIYDYNDYAVRIIAMAIEEGFVKIIKYSQMDPKLKDEFVTRVKIDRITSHIVEKDVVVFEDMEITNYVRSTSGYIFSGFDTTTGNELPNRLVKFKDIANGKFLADGDEISGDPFKK